MKERLECLLEIETGLAMQQLRVVPFRNAGRIDGLILVHADTPDQQPSAPGFRWPDDTLKISALTFDGRLLWQHDVGRGVIPGLWFCPVFPFDLDGDGCEEIYHVANPGSPETPLNKDAMEVAALSALDGRVLASAPLPWFLGNQTLSDTFRYLIHGGYSRGRPRLVTAQGCYHELTVHAWEYDGGLKLRWSRHIPDSEPGCRASHMFSVVDIDADGRDEVFVGERCIDIDTGEDKWVADREGYHGHSDIVLPTFDRASGRWSLYTTREFPWPEGSRGVVMFDDRGRELWGHRGMGHMHTGWTARLCDDGSHLCYAMEVVKHKVDGRVARVDSTNYLYDITGKPLRVPFELSCTCPIDIDGDGFHELLYVNGFAFRGRTSDLPGRIIDRQGNELGRIPGSPGHLIRSKILDCPGEQILTHDPQKRRLHIYGCPGGVDTPEASARYAHPYYKACQRLTAVGYNWQNLGGL